MDISVLLQKRLNVLSCLLESQAGLFVALLSLASSLFAPNSFVFLAVLLSVLIDGFFGTWASVRNGGYILSTLARQTFTKIASYLAVLVLSVVFERLMHTGTAYTAKGVGALIVACEFWSFSGHALVLFPNSVFFKLFHKFLKGEIEAKTGQKIE